MQKWLKITLISLVFLFLLFITLYQLTSGSYHVPATIAQNNELPGIVLNNYTFHSETFGNPKNQPIIVLHGGPCFDYKYLYPLKSLADQYFVIFYDQRGAGLSPRVAPEEITLKNYYADLKAFANRYALNNKISIVGHSWGAMLAAGFTGKYPELVNKLILAEPGFLKGTMADTTIDPESNISILYDAVKVGFEALHIKGPDKHARKDYFLKEMALKVNKGYHCNRKTPQLPAWRAGYVCFIEFMKILLKKSKRKKIDFTKGVSRYKGKALFLASECNNITGVTYQKEQMKFFPRTQLVVIPDAGHYMFQEQPLTTCKAIRRYLSE